MSRLVVESIPLLNEIKESLEASHKKCKREQYVCVDKMRKSELIIKERRISELLIHLYNIIPECSNSKEE